MLDHALARLFALLSRLRHDRAVHGRGEAWHGRLQVASTTTRWGLALLDESATYDVLVRRSRALGLPAWLPDVTGLAIRIPDAGGASRHQDLLLDTSGRSLLGRRIPTLHRSGGEHHYSSLLAWRAGGSNLLLGARDIGPARLALFLARPTKRWQPWATLELLDRMPQQAADELHLSPGNMAGGLELGSWLQRLRPDSYRASAEAAPD